MKKSILFFLLILFTSTAYANQWSVDEYIENCSVVHQKTIADSDRETVGYCMGVLKGALAGVLVTRSLESGEMKIPSCYATTRTTFWEIQKNILATMRLNHKSFKSAKEPNTANAAVVFALIELYPCLLD